MRKIDQIATRDADKTDSPRRELSGSRAVPLSVADKVLGSSRFWQAWTILAALGAVLASTRLFAPVSEVTRRLQGQAHRGASRTSARRTAENPAAPAASVDRLFGRLAVAQAAPERCALLDRIQASEDPTATYAITGLLERAQLGSVRACAAQALSRQPTPEAQSFLVDLAEDPEPEVHGSALEALATRDETARAVVVEATHADDLELRISAVKALLKAKRAEGFAAAVLVLPLIEDADTLSSLIDALGESHDPQALSALEALLDNAERESHLHAIGALGELGVASAAIRLESLLEVGSSEEFSAAADALQKLTPERAAAKLRPLLHSDNSERQALALSALIELAPPDLFSLMSQELSSGDARRVRLVLNRLAGTPEPAFEAQLIALAEGGDRHLRFKALQGLSKLSTASARAALERLLGSLPEPLAERFSESSPEQAQRARERRLSALARDESVGPDTLLRLARDPADDAQQALLRYLERHELPADVWASLVELAPSNTVRRIVGRDASEKAGVIEGLGRRADPQFADSLRAQLGREPATRNSAISALAALGDDSVREPLRQLAQSSDSGERDLAVRLLSARADDDAARALERLAMDPDPQVMSSALHTLQPRSPELVGRLALRALRQAAPEERANVLSLLSDLKASLSRPLLELALGDADDAVAVQAIQSLGNLQGPASAQRLLSLVNDSSRSETVRREAASGLRTMGGPLAQANRTLLDSLSEPDAAGEFVCSPN